MSCHAYVVLMSLHDRFQKHPPCVWSGILQVKQEKHNISRYTAQVKACVGEKGGTFLPVEGYFCQISFFVTLLLRCNSQIFIFRRRDIPFFDNVLQAKITQLIILSLHFLGNLKTFTNRYKSKMHFGIISNLSVIEQIKYIRNWTNLDQ